MGKHPEVEKRIAAAKVAVMAETALMHREFGRAKSERKYDGTRVTATDIAISKHIQKAITAQFPEDQFFSEELAEGTAPIAVAARYSWLLDPIDGTNNFANGIVYCAISLALLENGVPIYGVVYDLARRVLIHGGTGYGVWDGDRKAHVRREPPHSYSLIGFHSPVDKAYGTEAKRVIQNFKIRGLGSSTLHLAYTAVGLLNGVVEHNNKVWDIAAAVPLCLEAGAEIHYLNGSPFPLKEFSLKSGRVQYVAGNHVLSAMLLKILGRAET